MSDLTKLTIAETREGLKKRDFSAVEVTESYLKAMENGRKYNAYVLETPEIVHWKVFLWESKICFVRKGSEPPLVLIF